MPANTTTWIIPKPASQRAFCALRVPEGITFSPIHSWAEARSAVAFGASCGMEPTGAKRSGFRLRQKRPHFVAFAGTLCRCRQAQATGSTRSGVRIRAVHGIRLGEPSAARNMLRFFITKSGCEGVDCLQPVPTTLLSDPTRQFWTMPFRMLRHSCTKRRAHERHPGSPAYTRFSGARSISTTRVNTAAVQTPCDPPRPNW